MVIRVNKILITMFMLIGFLWVNTMPIYASNEMDTCQQKRVVYSREPITDDAVLYNRAKEGKTDLISDKSFIEDITFDEELVKEFSIKNYVTTQKLTEIRDLGVNKEAGFKEESYVTTVFTDITPLSYTSGGTYLEQPSSDGTGSVRCTLRVYYSYRTDYINNIYWWSARLDSVRSTWTVLDSQMAISNGIIRGTNYGGIVTGFDPHQESGIANHKGTDSGDYITKSDPTSGTAYTFTPSWHNWVNVYPEACHVGGKTDITITRKATGTKWNFSYPLKVNYTNFPN